jgi:hypothetical protein
LEVVQQVGFPVDRDRVFPMSIFAWMSNVGATSVQASSLLYHVIVEVMSSSQLDSLLYLLYSASTFAIFTLLR